MRREPAIFVNRLRGYLLEVIVLRLLEVNDFRLVRCHTDTDSLKRIREFRSHFIEFRGRGTWHQIDCPCDYNNFIPFINPIRLLGEVKYHEDPIDKAYIREFIGVIKDIQENYFVPDDYNKPLQRFTELGVFFSASGYDTQAERLAFAHNIKTISYKNNYQMEVIKNLIKEMERNYLSARKCLSDQGTFISLFKEILVTDYSRQAFQKNFNPAQGFWEVLNDLRNELYQIRASFIANTSGGVFLHFLSSDEFPEELFRQSDIHRCQVHYYTSYYGERYFYLTFSGYGTSRRFYFSPPTSLQEAAFYGGEYVLNEKERIFKTVHISTKIDGINRNLVLELDTDWLDSARSEISPD